MTRRDLLAMPMALQAQGAPTKFQLACMTLPYAAFPLQRALTGIKAAGYEHVAWGVNHERKPMLPVEAPESEAASLARRCRDMGLNPVMMFSTVFLEEPAALDGHRRRIAQAAAAGIPFVLTFGRTRPGEYPRCVAALKGMAPDARAAKLKVLIKQHGGNTGTGRDCVKMLRDVGEDSIQMCYDAGNVLDYESHDPLQDIGHCVPDIRAFCIKDHRDTPKDEDCGPGFGEIDHYKLLRHVMRTGLTMPLAVETVFEPLVPRPDTPEGVDALARRAREFIETVLKGLSRVI